MKQFKLFKLSSIFILISIFLFFGCKNFMNSSSFLDELDSSIEELNASSVSIYIAADTNTGAVYPNGTVSYKVGQTFSVTFTENDEYKFIKWEVLDKTTNLPINEVIEILSSDNNETKFKLLSNHENLYLHPLCVERPVKVNNYPLYVDEGVARDSSISVTFKKDLDPDNDFSGIEIYCGTVSVKDCYKAPVLNGNILTIPANYSNLIDASSGLKTISVIIPGTLYYKLDENEDSSESNKVTIGHDIQWTFKVNNSTNSNAEITFGVSENVGTIKVTPENTNTFSISQKINISFTPSFEYEFINWNIIDSNGNPVPDSILQVEHKNLTETTILVKEGQKGISVTPNCKRIPTVTSYDPILNSYGVTCYRPIVIKFNIPMNAADLHETFDNIEITDMGGANISDYFYLPDLDSDGKTLTIRPREDKINNIFTGTAVFSVYVKIKDIVKGKDTNGNITDFYSFNYVINKSIIDTKPIITEIELYRESEQTHKFSNEIYEKNINLQNLLEANLCKNEVYVVCKAVEDTIPISSVLVTETIIDIPSGNKILGNPVIIKNNNAHNKNVIFKEITPQHYTSNCFKYTLSSNNSGIIELSFRVKDAQGVISENEIKYYIVADTDIEQNAQIYFQKTNSYSLKDLKEFESYLPDENGEVDVSFYQIIGLAEKYYNKQIKQVNITINYWTDGEEKKELISVNNYSDESGKFDLSSYSFKKKYNKDYYVELLISDNIGNSYRKEYLIPASNEVGVISSSSTSITVTMKNKIYEDKNSQIKYNYYYKTNPSSDWSYSSGKYISTSNIQKLMVVGYLKNDDGTYTYSYPSEIIDITRTFPETNYTYPETNFVSLKKEKVFNKSGYVKFSAKLNSNFSEDDFKYVLGFENISTYEYFIPENYDSIYLPTKGKYRICVFAVNDNKEIKKYSASFQYEPGISIIDLSDIDTNPPVFTPNCSSSWSDYFSTQMDARGFNLVIHESILNDSQSGLDDKIYYCYIPNKITSQEGQQKLTPKIEQELDLKEHYVSFAPEDLSNDKGITLHLDNYFEDEGAFSVFARVYDKAGNYKTVALKAVNTKVSNMTLSPFINENATYRDEVYFDNCYDYITITSAYCINNSLYKDTISSYKLDQQPNEWQHLMFDTDMTITKLQNGFIYTSGFDNFYDKIDYDRSTWKLLKSYNGYFIKVESYIYNHNEGDKHFNKTLYFHSDYLKKSKKVCNKKNMMEGSNGYQIFTDKPALIQLLYNNKVLDSDMWATKGNEADVKYITSDCTYQPSAEVLAGIPEGSYYCVVVHFVDGTSAISSVKNK